MSRSGSWSGVVALALTAVLIGAWDAGAANPSAAAPPDGEQLFRVKGCSSCHVGPDSTAADGGQFPPLDTAAQWAGDRQPGLSASDYLAQSMVAPDAFISPVFRRGSAGPVGAMPTLALTAEEVTSLVDYLLEE